MEETKMKCPTCPETTLTMTERQGIEIDYCPQCRGVWLDRGELDKLIEKSTSPISQSIPSNDYRHSKHDSRDDYRKEHYYKKRKSFLSEIFD
jgi:Zn-finger nucleic acid-binding protein